MSEEARRIARQIAEEIVSVQPMPSDTFQKLYEQSKSESELRADGYKPVSRIGLMWAKE